MKNMRQSVRFGQNHQDFQSLIKSENASGNRIINKSRQSCFLENSIETFNNTFQLLSKQDKTVEQIVIEREQQEKDKLQKELDKKNNQQSGQLNANILALSVFAQVKQDKDTLDQENAKLFAGVTRKSQMRGGSFVKQNRSVCGRLSFSNNSSKQLTQKFVNKLQATKYLQKSKEKLFLEEQIAEHQDNILFLKKIKDKYGQETMRKIINCLKPQSLKHKNIIYNYGKTIDKCFILFKGSVNILCPSYSKYQYEVTPNKIEFQVRRDDDDKEIDLFFEDMRLVKSINPLQTFGEEHLWNRLPQTCTAICKGDVIMATLTLEDFQRILSDLYKDSELQQQRLFERRLENNFSLLDQVQGLKIIEKADLGIIVHFCETKHYKQHQIIYREGEKSDYLYIVKDGEVRLGQPMSQQLSLKEEISKETDIKQQNVYRDGGRDDHQYLWLSRANPGQMFGDQEVQDNTPRHYTAISTNGNTQILRFKISDFKNNLDLKSIARFNQMSQEKWNFVMNKDVAKIQGHQEQPEDFVLCLSKEKEIQTYQYFQVNELTNLKLNQNKKKLFQDDTPNKTKKEINTLNQDMYQDFIKVQENSKKFFKYVTEPRPQKVVELKQKDVKRFIEKISPLKRKQILKDFQNDDMKYLLNDLSKEHLIYQSQCRIRKRQELEIKTNYLKFLQDKEKSDKFDLTSLREVLREEFKKKIREQEVSNEPYRSDMALSKKGGMFSRYKSTDQMIVKNMQMGIDKYEKAQSCDVYIENNTDNKPKQAYSLSQTNNVFYRGKQINNTLKCLRSTSQKFLRLQEQTGSNPDLNKQKYTSFYKTSLPNQESNNTNNINNMNKTTKYFHKNMKSSSNNNHNKENPFRQTQ